MACPWNGGERTPFHVNNGKPSAIGEWNRAPGSMCIETHIIKAVRDHVKKFSVVPGALLKMKNLHAGRNVSPWNRAKRQSAANCPQVQKIAFLGHLLQSRRNPIRGIEQILNQFQIGMHGV
jgi:hypothetical protein